MKKNLLTLISFIAGMGCMIAYSIIGSEVAADGTLVESFFLIPVGYLFLAIAVISGIGSAIVSLFHKRHDTHAA